MIMFVLKDFLFWILDNRIKIYVILKLSCGSPIGFLVVKLMRISPLHLFSSINSLAHHFCHAARLGKNTKFWKFFVHIAF